MSEKPDYAAQFTAFGDVEIAERTRFQKVVAKTMAANVSTIPHVAHCDDVDVSGLEKYRAGLDRATRASPLVFLVKAVVAALEEFPQFNASLSPDGDALILKKYFHIGIAVDGPLGLLVPAEGSAAAQPPAASAAPVAAAAPNPANPANPAAASPMTHQQRYQAAYPIATKLTAGLGLRGFKLNLAVEAAANWEELVGLAPKIRAAVGADRAVELDRALGI